MKSRPGIEAFLALGVILCSTGCSDQETQATTTGETEEQQEQGSLTARWEQLLVDPKSFDGKEIFVTGALAVDTSHGVVHVRLYPSLERKQIGDRAVSCDLMLDDALLGEFESGSTQGWAKLDGRFFHVKGTFEYHPGYPEGGEVGRLHGPFLFSSVDGPASFATPDSVRIDPFGEATQ